MMEGLNTNIRKPKNEPEVKYLSVEDRLRKQLAELMAEKPPESVKSSVAEEQEINPYSSQELYNQALQLKQLPGDQNDTN
jgi:hypothetical protein